ncbi:MAG: hypothetical protein ABSE81_05390 [Candidatus Omnitrophota bacterium]|jgi:hypothetical protein
MKRYELERDRIWLIEHPEYERRVVKIDEFIVSLNYLNLASYCWPSVLEDTGKYYSGNYCEAVFVHGIGSGKGFKSSIMLSYELYKLLCLKNPQEYFGLSKDSPVFIVNVSVNAEQSRKVVFGETKAMIMNSPWFMKYNPPDPRVQTQLLFPKNISIFPGSSSETGVLGYNIFAAIMDEASFFISTPFHDAAEEIYNVLKSRMVSRFGDQAGPLVIISSPKHENDFVEMKMKEAAYNKRIFAVRRTLWEAKPPETYTKGWVDFRGYKIPKELEEIAQRNPGKFKRDYMAIPSGVIDPYFTQYDLIDAAIDPKMESPIDENGNFKSWFMGQGHGYRIHVDLSLRKDATGLVMAHSEEGVIYIDLMMQIKAPPNGEINFSTIRDIIFDLSKRHFDIHGVTFDGWQSQDSIQILRDQGISADVLSVDRDMKAYDTLKDLLYSKKIKTYYFEPFIKEVKQLEFIEGKKIDHPPHGSKDVSDAVAGAVFMCVSNPNNFSFTGMEEIAAQRKALRAQGIDPDSVMGRSAQRVNKDKLVRYGECDGRYFSSSPIGWR